MTVAILDFPAQTPTTRELMERALEPHILVGMPHLTPFGLSETWLMKELGHRHWLMLARDMGMADADFRTAAGGEAYAAICATSLRHARLEQVCANDILTIRSALAPVSKTQVSSVHRLSVGAQPIAEVELLSTFVHRLKAGDNSSIARIPLPGISMNVMQDNQLAVALRRFKLSEGPTSPDCKLPRIRLRSSPSQEFNGAGLFYFAEFQALMERAREQLCPESVAATKISHRDVFFFGNLQEHEDVEIELDGNEKAPELRCRLYRPGDKLIAYAEVGLSPRF